MINLAKEKAKLITENNDLRLANAELQSIINLWEADRNSAWKQIKRIIEILDPEQTFPNIMSGFDDRSLAGILNDIVLLAKCTEYDKQTLERKQEYLVEQIEELTKRHDQ